MTSAGQASATPHTPIQSLWGSESRIWVKGRVDHQGEGGRGRYSRPSLPAPEGIGFQTATQSSYGGLWQTAGGGPGHSQGERRNLLLLLSYMRERGRERESWDEWTTQSYWLSLRTPPPAVLRDGWMRITEGCHSLPAALRLNFNEVLSAAGHRSSPALWHHAAISRHGLLYPADVIRCP